MHGNTKLKDKIGIYCDRNAVHVSKQVWGKGRVHHRIDHEDPEGGEV
jgi:hypothetical protein